MRSSQSFLRRPLSLVFAALLGAVLGVTGAPSAKAVTLPNNFGSLPCAGSPRSCVSLADNALHTWYWEGKFGNQIPGIDDSMQITMDDLERRTDLTTSKAPGSATLDVLVTDYDYGMTGILGWTECLPSSATTGTHPALRCDRQKVRLNGSYPEYFETSRARRSLTCHEVGHTIGLRHTTDSESCMRSPFDPDDFDTLTSSHDNAEINAHY